MYLYLSIIIHSIYHTVHTITKPRYTLYTFFPCSADADRQQILTFSRTASKPAECWLGGRYAGAVANVQRQRADVQWSAKMYIYYIKILKDLYIIYIHFLNTKFKIDVAECMKHTMRTSHLFSCFAGIYLKELSKGQLC